mgnify:CR=1 FL=1
MRILIVEDDPQLGDGLHSGLTSLGFRPDWVRDVPAASAALAEDEYAAVVLDLMLPGMGGNTVCQRIKGDSRTAHIPVLMLTARSTEIDRVHERAGLSGRVRTVSLVIGGDSE